MFEGEPVRYRNKLFVDMSKEELIDALKVTAIAYANLLQRREQERAFLLAFRSK